MVGGIPELPHLLEGDRDLTKERIFSPGSIEKDSRYQQFEAWKEKVLSEPLPGGRKAKWYDKMLGCRLPGSQYSVLDLMCLHPATVGSVVLLGTFMFVVLVM